MGLSKDLISQFAKVTTDDEKIKETKEQTVYGETVEYNGELYARIDGSDVLTPISRTTDVEPGERVTVLIKDHSAVVTGNLSSPSARTDDVQEIGSQISEFEIVIADKVSTIELDAERARIDELEAENVTINGTLDVNNADIEDLKAENVTISDTLAAKTAEIENLKVDKLDATVAETTYATIADAEITDANIYNLTATYGDFVDFTTTKFDAVDGYIDDLETNKLSAINADIQDLNASKATISELEATNANVNNLQAEVADIDTLLNGNLTSEHIQSLTLTSENTVIEDAMIKDAMISDLGVDKLKAGDISTNKFNIVSDSGNFIIADNTIQVTDGTKVRVQIGKDANGDYNMYVWDPTGNLMFDATGITEDAIQSAIIRDDMVSTDANINAAKIDIGSLFTVINEDNTQTLNSSKIMFDAEGQTLDIKLQSLTTDLNTLNTSVDIANGSIATIISKTDLTTIEDQGTTFYDQYNTTKSTLDSWELALGNQESTFSELINSVQANNAKISATPTTIEAVITSNYLDTLDTVQTMKSSISLNQGTIESKVSKDGIVSAINQTEETIKISASKIQLEGTTEADKIVLDAVTAANEYADDLNNTLSTDLSSLISDNHVAIEQILSDKTITTVERAELQNTVDNINFETAALLAKIDEETDEAIALGAAQESIVNLLTSIIEEGDYTTLDFDFATSAYLAYREAVAVAELVIATLEEERFTEITAGQIDLGSRVGAYEDQLAIEPEQITMYVIIDGERVPVTSWSHQELAFLSEGSIASYFANQRMYIEHAEVINSLKAGNHTQEKYGDNYTVFRYTGG